MGPDPNVAGNTRYEVSLNVFRDCGGATLDLRYNVAVRQGCAGAVAPGSPFLLNRVGIPAYGSPYCPSQAANAVCSSTGGQIAGARPNYEVALYRATVSLPQAPEWLLSVEVNARPALANIEGFSNLRLEAVMRNRIAMGGQVHSVLNTSPTFSTLPVSFVPWNKPVLMNMGAFDADGDSLRFSLDRPLEDCNIPDVYKPIPNQPIERLDTVINGFPIVCAAFATAGTPTTFSAAFPLPSYSVSGVCPVRTASPYFNFNSATGSLAFKPAFYDAATPSSAGKTSTPWW
ncbi:hypothetical protein [Hymenobacter koreensis]|uniref:Uncharacterized protein n=1 Tax=Hymenobacter koreensis TaxID=1084523 RepID=A0ABP8JLV8_9BACT